MIELREVGKIRKVAPVYESISKDGCRRYICQMDIANSSHNFFVEFTVEVDSTVSINVGDKAELIGDIGDDFPYKIDVIINDKRYEMSSCEVINLDGSCIMKKNYREVTNE